MKKAGSTLLIIAILIGLIWVLDVYEPQIKSIIKNGDSTSHSNVVPKGAVYTVCDAKNNSYIDIHSGGKFPEEVNNGDLYTYENIQYEYFVAAHSWVYVSYNELPNNLLKEINGIPVLVKEFPKNALDVGLGQAADVTVKDAGEIIYNTVS